jgi:BirA family biotin operon repressor/biotin-[acetyl-CoA-carboxylase] ligase
VNPVAVRWLLAVSSTQDALHTLAEQGAPAGTAVAAIEQTAGRGARRSDWSSGPGGLWLSVLLRPGESLPSDVLSLRVGLALVRALEDVGGRGLALKWPNDIMAEGRKAGGILCEARWTGDRLGWIAVGAGLNLRNQLPAALRSAATRLLEHGIALTPEALAPIAAAAICDAGARAGMLSLAERHALAERDWLRGRAVQRPMVGEAVGILADGALQVRRPDGTIELVRAGLVEAGPRIALAE